MYIYDTNRPSLQAALEGLGYEVIDLGIVRRRKVDVAADIPARRIADLPVDLDGPGEISNLLALSHRGLSIAGGTSEIKRNQIGERIIGLPRDPLLK